MWIESEYQLNRIAGGPAEQSHLTHRGFASCRSQETAFDSFEAQVEEFQEAFGLFDKAGRVKAQAYGKRCVQANLPEWLWRRTAMAASLEMSWGWC